MKKLYLKSFGCQMNERDSEAVTGLLLDRGWETTPEVEGADLLLYNTCSIRDHAEQKVFGRMGSFRKMKERNPRLVIGIMGCMAQEHAGGFFKRNPDIDLVCGTGNISQIPGLVDEILDHRVACLPAGRRVATDRVDDAYDLDGIQFRRSAVKAMVTIMKGCDHRCTYCIVPYTRGVEISRNSESILREMNDLETRGFKDVMLLGQNVNSYGKGLAEGLDFTGLLEKIQAHAPGIARLRFITSHPKDAHTRLFQTMRDLPMVCEHLHLPVQSGSDRILKRMKREHTRAWYLEQIEEYRSFLPEGSLTSDLIVGFPGETERDFLDTLELVEAARFDAVFSFEYSPRPGTPALKLADDVPAEEKRRRLVELQAVQRAVSLRNNQAYVGRTVEVLFEHATRRDENRWAGRTRTFKRVVAAGGPGLEGNFRQMRVAGVSDETLLGEPVS